MINILYYIIFVNLRILKKDYTMSNVMKKSFSEGDIKTPIKPTLLMN